MEKNLMKILTISTNRIKELTATVKVLNETLTSSFPDDGLLLKAEINASKLESGLNKLRNDLNNYFRFVNDTAVDDISEITTFQLEAEENLGELQVKIKRAKPSTSRAPSTLTITGKLPKLAVPEFDGDILQWHQFWDQFKSQVDNRQLSDVDKLLYLTSSLRGEAKKLVEGLEITNNNYDIAVNILTSRFGKLSQVKDAHYSALSKITSAGTSVSDCRRVLNDIERHLRVLNSLGEDTDHSFFRFLIMEKFPEELVYELKKKTTNESVSEIRTELENLISAKEDANRVTRVRDQNVDDFSTRTLHVKENFRKKNMRGKSNNFRSDYTGNDRRNMLPMGTPVRNTGLKRKYNFNRNTNVDHIPTQNKRTKKACEFCNGDHYNDQCRKFKTLEERKAELKDRCYMCFRKGHIARRCTIRKRCYHCKQSHDSSLCPQVFGKKEITKQFHVNNTGFTILQTAIISIAGNGDSACKRKCRVLLDSGSQRSYITQKLAQELKLKVVEESTLTIFTFGSNIPQEIDSPRVTFDAVTRFGKTITMSANMVPIITHSIPYPAQELFHWKDKSSLADDGSLSDRVDLLIGNDYYFSLMSTEKIKVQENLYMVKSEFGWILSGRTDSRPVDELAVVTYFQANLEVRLNQPDLPFVDTNLKELWELEAIGITDSPKESREEEAIRQFNETTEFRNNRYQVSWPWIEYPPDLKANFGLAFGRLVSLVKRLDAETLMSYDQLIREQEGKGIVETVPEKEINESCHPVHYLPHHGVKQANKPIRIVYDASSKIKDNKSLNQCLYCGPLMLEDLTGLLLKFRSHAIGLCADVEKAFLQIGLQNKDRDVTRFLWIKDINQPVDSNNLLHMRFCRVPFGVIASPFLLNATIKHHLSLSSLENMRSLAQDIYVDNLVTGKNTTEEAKELYNDSKKTFQQISMNLREWSSNSSEVMHHIPEKCHNKVVKVLGLDWELKNDTLHLRFKETENANTKRGVLKTIASIYDPCGYTVPSLLPAKLLLQDLWKLKVKWDAPMPKEIVENWKYIREELEQLKEICIPRCYTANPQKRDYQLHCFTDASLKAYSAVVYITQGKQKSFVIGKSRLVPIKDQADLKIPRLELLGALIGSRLIQYVLKYLQGVINQQILWIDSQIVIDWYHSNKLLTPFVARRIEEIKRNKGLNVRYVPSSLNPADVATRPSTSKEERARWLEGPDFIIRDPSEWPSVPTRHVSLSAGEGLSKASDVPESMEIDTNCETVKEANYQVVSLDRNSQRLDDNLGIIYTTVAEIKREQAKHFSEELNGKVTSLKRNLDLFLDEDGILRCKGRLQHADWTYDKRYPILMPKDSEYTDGIIMKVHSDNYHVGATHTLSIIRQSFWIPQGKRQVMKVINKCPQCIKHGGGPFKLPPTPALPPERVNYTNAFTFTGVDYLGPILVKTSMGTEKRWICLFTCLAVRAVHLEVVRDLTAEEGLLALRRFISTKGVPTVITSDNATNFKLMSEVLSKPYCIDRKIKWRFIPQLAPWFGGYYERLMAILKNCLRRTLQKHLLTDNQMNTVIKEIEAVINSRPLTYVNDEPIHILTPSDFIAMGRTIVVGTENDQSLPQGTHTKIDLVTSWRRGITALNEFKEMFINRYLLSLRERYAHSHRQPRCTSKLVPSEGQTVQIKGDSKNREVWQVGKIESLVKGADNMCRVAKVKVGDKEFTRSIAQLYPLEVEDVTADESTSLPTDNVEEGTVAKDCQEIRNDTAYEGEKETTHITDNGDSDKGSQNGIISPNDTELTDITEDDSTEPRQQRNAAIQAREKIRRWTQSLISLL